MTRTGSARGVTVRQATEDDLPAVVELRVSLLREHRSDPIYGRVRRDFIARARRLFLSQLRSPNEVTLLAERQATAIGILRCVHSAGHPLLNPETYGYISSVYVRREARRAGVLRALVRAASGWCRERGLDELRLHSAAHNPVSNAAWEALGFRIVEHLRMKPLE